MGYGYIDDVKYALIQSGGEAFLEDIIAHVLTRRSERRATTGHLKEYVWSTLQNNCKGRGRNVFDHDQDQEGKVIWKLK